MIFDDLSLNKPLLMFDMVILIRSVFEEVDTYYPQIFLEEALYDEEKYVHVSIYNIKYVKK